MSVPDDLITADELETLRTRKGRRDARHEVRKAHGWSAAHALKRLQRRQSQRVASVQDEGPDGERTQEIAAEMQEARSVLAQVTTEDASNPRP